MIMDWFPVQDFHFSLQITTATPRRSTIAIGPNYQYSATYFLCFLMAMDKGFPVFGLGETTRGKLPSGLAALNTVTFFNSPARFRTWVYC